MEEREFGAPRLTAPLLSPPSDPVHGLLTLPDDPSDITEVNPWALATSTSSLFSVHTEVGTIPLFVTPPRWSQINQQQLGNCWFLASISSILFLPDGPTRIYHMMREDPTHVVVRLYDNKR